MHPNRTLFIAGFAAALAGPALDAPAAAGIVNVLVAELRGGQEVPPNGSSARGCARFTIDTNANTLSYYINFSGLGGGETAAHIHGFSGPGVNSGVVHPLPLGSPKIGVWTYPQSAEDDILNGRTYVNVHSTVFPGGEIRGQIVKAVATLDGFQEVPPTACTSWTGWGVFTIDVCKNELDYYIMLEGAPCGVETAAHIHGPAIHGINAGVLHNLPAGNPKVGTWIYPETMETAILQGKTYVNVHTNVFPGGAIRGQITNILVPIDGSQEVPANASPSTGCGFMSIDKDANQLGFYFRYFPFATAETVAHIHGFSGPGVNSGILFGLPAGNPKVGMWNYAAAQEAGILGGLTYVNVHSTAFPGGEIRGQIVIPAKKAPCDCPWDMDGDGFVAITDFLEVLAQWGTDPGGPPDFNGDGDVGIVDFLQLLAAWGPCP
jgi:hypothetical protein